MATVSDDSGVMWGVCSTVPGLGVCRAGETALVLHCVRGTAAAVMLEEGDRNTWRDHGWL